MYRQGWLGVAVMVIVAAGLNSASAREQYLQEFQGRYAKFFSGNAEATKCTVCHPGLIKRSRNIYGKSVNQILTGRNVKDLDQVRQALIDAEKEPSEVPGRTFGDLIKAGVLPAAKGK